MNKSVCWPTVVRSRKRNALFFTCKPFRNVPLRLPRSSSWNDPSASRNRRACLAELGVVEHYVNGLAATDDDPLGERVAHALPCARHHHQARRRAVVGLGAGPLEGSGRRLAAFQHQ